MSGLSASIIGVMTSPTSLRSSPFIVVATCSRNPVIFSRTSNKPSSDSLICSTCSCTRSATVPLTKSASCAATSPRAEYNS